jgi:hypothetical protein
MSALARWGASFELRDHGAVLRDRTGQPLALLEGDRVRVRGGPGLADELTAELTIEDVGDHHPIFGPCLRMTHAGELRSLMGAVSWRAPQAIPPVAAPARLPPFAGSMVLNLLALLAERAGVAALPYLGPYPSAVLYQSLVQCFTASGGEGEFTAEGEALLAAPRMARAPVTFAPAPFARWWLPPGLGVQARDRIERLFVDGATFVGDGGALRRLVAYRSEPGGADDRDAQIIPDEGVGDHAAPPEFLAAELWFGDVRWATRAEVWASGALRRAPAPPPPPRDPIVGQPLPLPLRRALATLIEDAVPRALATSVAPILEATPLRWGDAGDDAVRPLRAADGSAVEVVVHAALWITLRSHGAARLALALAEALTPWVVREAVRRAEATH